MRRLEGRNDALGPREQLEPGEGLGIGARDVGGATVTMQRRVLRSDPRVIKTRGDRMRPADLPVVVLEDERPGPVEDADRSAWTVSTCSQGDSAIRVGFSVLFSLPATMESSPFENEASPANPC